LVETVRRFGARARARGERPHDVVDARARFWAELREGQREADARVTRRGCIDAVGYEVETTTHRIGGDDFHIRALRDRQQYWDPDGEAERAGISSATWPLFGLLWPAGIALAEEMSRFAVAGKSILEVGCGLGLGSLVLQRRGANITACDHHPLAEEFLPSTRLTACRRSRSIRRRGRVRIRSRPFDRDQGDLLYGADIPPSSRPSRRHTGQPRRSSWWTRPLALRQVQHRDALRVTPAPSSQHLAGADADAARRIASFVRSAR
jgi:hypothetical protein